MSRSFVSVEALRTVLGTCGSHHMDEGELAQLLAMLPVDAEGRVPFSQLRDLECWDLPLPGGDVVSLRNPGKWGRQAMAAQAASESAASGPAPDPPPSPPPAAPLAAADASASAVPPPSPSVDAQAAADAPPRRDDAAPAPPNRSEADGEAAAPDAP